MKLKTSVVNGILVIDSRV